MESSCKRLEKELELEAGCLVALAWIRRAGGIIHVQWALIPEKTLNLRPIRRKRDTLRNTKLIQEGSREDCAACLIECDQSFKQLSFFFRRHSS